jgi:hypothetical protein
MSAQDQHYQHRPYGNAGWPGNGGPGEGAEGVGYPVDNDQEMPPQGSEEWKRYQSYDPDTMWEGYAQEGDIPYGAHNLESPDQPAVRTKDGLSDVRYPSDFWDYNRVNLGLQREIRRMHRRPRRTEQGAEAAEGGAEGQGGEEGQAAVAGRWTHREHDAQSEERPHAPLPRSQQPHYSHTAPRRGGGGGGGRESTGGDYGGGRGGRDGPRHTGYNDRRVRRGGGGDRDGAEEGGHRPQRNTTRDDDALRPRMRGGGGDAGRR